MIGAAIARFVKPMVGLTLAWLFRRGVSLIETGTSWHAPLFASVAPLPGERILNIGSTRLGCKLAAGFPAAVFVTALHEHAQEGRKRAQTIDHHNHIIVRLENTRIRKDDASFDKIICALTLHLLRPKEKLSLLREMFRVLRPHGSLYIVDYDRPQTAREQALLDALVILLDDECFRVHRDGTWIDLIRDAGFSKVRNRHSSSEILARLSIIQARRR